MGKMINVYYNMEQDEKEVHHTVYPQTNEIIHKEAYMKVQQKNQDKDKDEMDRRRLNCRDFRILAHVCT